MIILLDENIPQAANYFESFCGSGGELRFKAGRSILSEDLSDVDALIVRSVTTVNEDLLAGSPVRFVGSCTIGMDHIDTEYLTQHEIRYANAPACNANSVVEYVFAALLKLGCDWQSKRLGIIGMGNVGSALYRRAQDLGIECVGYDPLIEQDRYPVLGDLEQVLACDIVSMHAPLTHTGPAPSFQMISQHEIAQLKPGSVLLNCGRGDCLDNRALLQRIEQQGDLLTVLDVWQDEPQLHLDVLNAVDIATPHVAGYSYDGKVAGTRMIANSLAECLNMDAPAEKQTADAEKAIVVDPVSTAFEALTEIVPRCYDLAGDDERLRTALAEPSVDIAKAFDLLRKHYPKRREFCHFTVFADCIAEEKEKQRLEQSLAALGYSQ